MGRGREEKRKTTLRRRSSSLSLCLRDLLLLVTFPFSLIGGRIRMKERRGGRGQRKS